MTTNTIMRYSAVSVLLLLALLLGACQPIQRPVGEGSTVPAVAEANDASMFVGDWAGDITIAGITLRIALTLANDDGVWSGTMDVPQQAAANIPVHDIVVDGSSIGFQILEGDPLATFSGAIDGDGVISGEFTQGGMPGTFTLGRVVEADAPAVPYVEDEVTFESPGATLAGTLTLPEGEGPFPALVLVTGSGAQNRNEELALLAGYRPFYDIADRLTQAGFAVLRYDDRGAGESTGDFATATIDDFADDATAAIAYLRGRPEIDPAQVGILGHSEGANVAGMVAARDPEIPWAVAWAGTAVPGSDVIKLQAVLQAQAGGTSGEELESLRAIQNSVVDLMLAEDWSGLEATLRDYLNEQFDKLTPEEQASVGDRDAAIDQQVQAQLEAAQSVWFQSFMRHNPAEDWALVTAPVLAFFGELDTQVDPAQNRPPMEAALINNPDVTIVEIPEANHLFLKAVTGGAAEYASLDPTLIPEFLDTLTAWLTERATFVQ